MAAKPQEKFEAAVKVIQSLPKNGSFQPSNELLLKFYGYYKQATLGPCNTQKPAFYDIVGKAKWDAWNKLGKMPAEEAMLSYVEELKKILREEFGWKIDKATIVEAMPHTTMVAEFVEKLGSFYELVDDNNALAKAKKTPAVEDGSVANGDVPRQNGTSSPKQNGTGNGSAQSTPQHSVSDESSESLEVSPESSPMHHAAPPPVNPISQTNEVVLARIPTKTQDDGSADDSSSHEHSPPPPIQPPLHNGGMLQNGRHTYPADTDELTDSDGEEFCDTSDLPDEQLRSVSRTSSPEVSSHSIVTTATVHHPIDAESASHVSVVPSRPTYSLHQAGSDHVTCRGGGDTGVNRQVTEVSGTGRMDSPGGTGRGTPSWGTQPTQHTHLLATGGGSGGDRDPNYGGQRSEVNEQIAVALVRLQQDMNSVLARLNTLEALSVAQHQIHRSRQNSESDRPARTGSRGAWWWPFPRLDARSVFFIMAWPLIIHWVLTLLARRRHRRR